MIEAIKQRILASSIKQALHKRKHSPSALPFEKAVEFGVFFDGTDETQRKVILDSVKKWRDMGKRIKVMAYFDNAQETGAFPFEVLSKKQLSWFGKPHQNAISYFTDHTFDYFIHVGVKPSVMADYIAAHSRAGLFIGPTGQLLSCFDLLIEPKDKQLKSFLAEFEDIMKKRFV